MNSTSQKTDIDFYNIFNLIGMSTTAEFEKNKFLNSMYGIILREFISTSLPLSKKPDDLLELQDKLNQNATFDEILTLIEKSNPDFLTSLIDYVRKSKEKIIMLYFTDVLNSLSQKINDEKERAKKIELSRKMEYYTIAVSFAKKQRWADLNSYFNLYPTFDHFLKKYLSK